MQDVVLLCHPYHRGGVTQWMIDTFSVWNNYIGVAQFLTVNPVVDFVSATGRPKVLSLLSNNWQEKACQVSVGRVFELSNISYKASIYRGLVDEFVKENIPIIPSDDESCWYAASLCSNRNPMIVVLHADESVYFRLVQKYKDYITAIVCVSRRIQDKLIELFPQFSGLSFALPCGILVDEFDFQKPKSNSVTWIGRLSKYQKRAQDIVPIVKLLVKKWPEIQFNVVGDGEYSAALNQEISDEMLTNNVNIFGWIQNVEVKKILSETKVFLQTSDFEGTSVAMMEALASGCIIVSTRVSGVEDLENLSESRDVVYLYSIGDTRGGAELIGNAMKDNGLEVSSSAAQLAKSHFDCKNNNIKLVYFISECLKVGSVKKPNTVTIYSKFFGVLLGFLRLSKWKLLSIRVG